MNSNHTRTIGCEDICDTVIEMLRKMGYKLGAHPEHRRILKILNEDVKLVKKEVST